MTKGIMVSVVVGCFCFGAVSAQGVGSDGLAMPPGFEGIYPGMSVGQLMEIRPSAAVPAMDQHRPAQVVDTTDPNQSLHEYVAADSVYGLSMFAAYTFLEGDLKHTLLIWTGPMTQIRKHRRGFISQCLRTWGQDYERRVTEIEPGTSNEQLAPVLVWNKENITVAVLCTSENPGKHLEVGTFMINVFSEDYSPAANALIGKTVGPGIRDGLFQEIGIPSEDSSIKNEN